MRSARQFTVENPKDFKQNLLHWSRQFQEVAWLDSNEYIQKHGEFDALLAVGAFTAIKTDYHNAFDKLQEYQETTKDWIFGYLSYDLKNDVEKLSSRNFDGLAFPDLYFFQPQKLFLLKGEHLEMQYLRMVDDEMEDDLEEIKQGDPKNVQQKMVEESPAGASTIVARTSEQDYLKKVEQMLNHIQRGDIYEANFCQEFFSENRVIVPSSNIISPNLAGGRTAVTVAIFLWFL